MNRCKQRRLFFAIDVPSALHPELESVPARCRLPVTARPVPSSNLHLTLAFLGSLPEQRLPGLLRLANAIRQRPFELTLDRLGYWARPQVLWAAPTTTPSALSELAGDLRRRLRAGGFPTEEREYRPHLTLARKVRTAEIPDSFAADLAASAIALSWQVEQFHLIESVSTRRGVRYPLLHSWPLHPAY